MSTQAERIQFFRRTVLDFLRKSGRSELPWRRKGISAYEVWVSEIMLQQTQVARVIDYYERFLQRFPTVQKLSKASWEVFLPYYEGLGYYARGRNMLRTAKAVVEEYQGNFPKTVGELKNLPGIGPYTARAIASFAYGTHELAWDTNLKRVLGRFFFGAKDRAEGHAVLWLDRELGKAAPWLNAALMDFGSALCTARPKCTNCPLALRCRYSREKGKSEPQSSKPGVRKGIVSRTVRAQRAIVWLHANHKQYFSSLRKTYRPFFLPEGYTTRAAIKGYFHKKYGLVLAVRPPHATRISEGQTHLCVHAQILLGKPLFPVFPKSAVVEYTKKEW